MRDPFRHLPFALVIFILLVTGATDLGLDAGFKVLVTLLAPVLWLGLYLLFGTDRAAIEDRQSRDPRRE